MFPETLTPDNKNKRENFFFDVMERLTKASDLLTNIGLLNVEFSSMTRK